MSRVLVVGGGLAGAAAASALGSRAVLVERMAAPHDKICGEFLSVEAGVVLAGLGFDLGRMGGRVIDRVRVRGAGRAVEAKLPFCGTGISRRVLDAALLEHAEGRGAKVVLGERVASLEASGAKGPVFLATGKHELRGVGREGAGTIDDMVGFKQYFRGADLGSVVEILLFEGGYAGMQMVEGGLINVCLVIDKARFQALGGQFSGVLEMISHGGWAFLADCVPVLGAPLSISGVPYGYLAPDDGLWRLGDQAAVIPSFCGDGMSIALHSGRLAARVLGDGGAAPAYRRQLMADVGRQVRLAAAVQRFTGGRLGRMLAMAGLSAVPGLAVWLAKLTRVREGALVAPRVSG